MIVKRLNLSAIDTGALNLGFVGENEHTQYRINCASVFTEYPNAVASMLVKSPSGVVYPKTITTDGSVIVWTVTESDTAEAGSGQIQLTFTESGAIVKTVIAATSVNDSLVGDDPPPEPIQTWIEEANTILEKVDGLTATAEALPTGSDPTATVSTVGGHYNIDFGIPGGSGGDPTEIIDDTAGAGDVTKVWSASKTYGEVTQLKSAKAPVILRDASGDIVSITDGAGGMPLSACTVQANPVQTGSGDPSPENVRPITGWTASNISRTGKNLLGGTALRDGIKYGLPGATDYPDDKYIQYAAYASVNASFTTLCGLTNRFKENTAYTFIITISKTSGIGANMRVLYTDGTSTDIPDVSAAGVKQTLVLVSNATKTVASLGKWNYSGSTLVYYDECGIFEGVLTAADFVPYQGTTYSITFPDSAGTVYGGVVDLAAKTLTVDMVSVDLGTTSGWTYNNTSYSYGFFTVNVSDRKKGSLKLVCSDYATATGGRNTMASDGMISTYNTTNSESVCIRNDAYTDVESFVASLSGVQLVYELATSITYSLSDLPTILTLPGYNAIWADTGAISLTYPADTKTYVDDHTPVQDVQINGNSILTNGIGTIAMASSEGVGYNASSHSIYAAGADLNIIKAGTNNYRGVPAGHQHEAVFYGLAKLAGADMASSSNPVGTYTDAAKVAIQKMLGIYQAPWELIREDTFTNASEADHIITVDGNGQAFELTDAVLFTVFPSQETGAKAGDYGRTYFYNGNTVVTVTYLGAVTISANASAYGGISKVVNHGGMIETSYVEYATMATHGYLRASLLSGEGTPFNISSATIDKIVIRKITGTANYKLYGRRKWN